MTLIGIPIHITKEILFKEVIDPLSEFMKALNMELGHSFLICLTLAIRLIVRTISMENCPTGSLSVLSLKIIVIIFEIKLNKADNVADFVRERLVLFAGPINEESHVLFGFRGEATAFTKIVGV